MICPYCEKSVMSLSTKQTTVSQQKVLILACPSCKKVIGTVNKTD